LLPSLLVRNVTILTMNDALDVVEGAVAVRNGRIAAVGDEAAMPAGPFDTVLDGAHGILLPGFVQTHLHLCQTLFRGLADDLPLMDWLRRRIWPLEAAHDVASLRASARLASAELLLSGTTAVLTMETVHDTDAVLEVLAETGLRATVGKCMMDLDHEAPGRLREQTRASIENSLALHRRWHGAAGGRLRVSFAPRFAVSCSRDLLEAVAGLSDTEGLLVHTHAAESRAEAEIVRGLSGGLSSLAYLGQVGLATPRLCAAHCVWVDDAEQALAAERGIKVLHCPGSNLKLGSGIAPVVEMKRRGICVSLGADGAACNNRLDMFGEMRLAATLQAMRVGPGALTARDVLWMATRNGARTLGLDQDIGAVAPGMRADFIILERDRPHLLPAGDPYSAVVYGAGPADVRTTVVDGVIRVRDFALTSLDARGVAAEAAGEARRLVARAGL
jgi:5-methylthioadenosine/S-adenosylhomocysteine deaminase